MAFLKKIFGSKTTKDQVKQLSSDNEIESNNNTPKISITRLDSVLICIEAGFMPANSLPTEFDKRVRPSIEIGYRLNALKALVLWLMVSEENLSSERILNFVNKNGLERFITDEEKVILISPRNDEEYRNIIGWKFENAWPLAWYFGYIEPEKSGQMMTGDQMQEILLHYSCPLDVDVKEWVENKEIVAEDDLIKKEDLFYCLHNAVRSAQLGGETVPQGFDPIINGGVIHERRHSLTWMLSNGIEWDDTDLSS